MSQEKILVTRSYLPDVEQYKAYIDTIWERCHLTNKGPLLVQLESELKNFLGVKNFHFVSNGTIALQISLRALGITEGEIITTPFSYVATTSSILWERCRPVFVDISPETLCIDVTQIESAITKDTKAIMAVHVFGYPCAVEELERIARKHNLVVIYDGAHAFGARYKGRALLDYGDISTCSFHATKLFHTIEGGCVIARDDKTSEHLELIRSFGHIGDDYHCLGINAKASEFQAAMGLCNIGNIASIIAERKEISELYDAQLHGTISKPKVPDQFEYNYAYYPAIFPDEGTCTNVIKALNEKNIFPRRYFYPSLNTLNYLENYQPCPISESIASRILCLPLYVGLEADTIKEICNIIKSA